MKYSPIIGLEVHIQLNTTTKLFCSCLNEYSPEEPNKNICPFCTGQPGALPLLNKEAVKKAILFGVAVGGKIPEKTRWDRKNYFYPDLPSGYQISQYDNPIVEKGKLEFYVEDKDSGKYNFSSVSLTRAHLESDAAKLLHIGGKTMVDFNRSGAPLIEVVTDPVMTSAAQAMAFVAELQLLVRKIGISEADMEKGHMRFDCNLSLQTEAEKASNKLPKYRVETKNINSIRALGRSIEYEIKRQAKILEDWQTPVQETRGWKDDLNKSFSQRSKEDAMDYRYFPEPDLQILQINSNDIPRLENFILLPGKQRQRYLDLGLPIQSANTYVNNERLGAFFEQCLLKINIKDTSKIKTVSNIISGNLLALSLEKEIFVDEIVSNNQILDLAGFFENNAINNQGLQSALEILSQRKNQDVQEVLEQNKLLQINDNSLLSAVALEVIKNNPKPVEEFKSGKEQVIGFLVGQCMKTSQGQGNPQRFKEILTEELKK